MLVCSRRPEERVVYDGAAIFLLVLLILFAMSMAGVDWIFEHYQEYQDAVVHW